MSEFQRHALKTLLAETSSTFRPETGNEVWNLNLDQIESDTGRILTKQMVSADNLGPSTYWFEAGTVLYSKLRPYLNKVVVANDSGFATTELVPVCCNPEKLLPQYLAYFLRSSEFLQFANIVVAGAKMPRMVMSEFWNYKIPVPSLPDQRRIAAILDQADALRAKRREALAQLDSLAQSIFIEMFGDPVTNPKGWPKANLASVCHRPGEYGAGLSSTTYRSNLPRYVRITDITESGNLNADPVSPSGSAEDWSGYELQDGDLLFARSGATVGKTFLYKKSYGPCVFAGYLIRFKPEANKLRAAYLFHFTHTSAYHAWVKAKQRVVAQPNINAKQYGEDLSILLPPLQLQKEFEVRIEALEAQKVVMQQSLNEIDVLFSSLQNRAFRGEL